MQCTGLEGDELARNNLMSLANHHPIICIIILHHHTGTRNHYQESARMHDSRRIVDGHHLSSVALIPLKHVIDSGHERVSHHLLHLPAAT